MKKLMIGVLTGFLFLGAAAHRSYADPCGCGGYPGGRGDGMSTSRGMAHQGPGFMDGSPRAGLFLWKKLMGLGLSDKQIEALKAIRIKVEKETIKKRADLQLARVELGELLGRNPVDMSAVEANLKKAEAVRTDLRLSHIKAREEVKAILTPEQQKKLKEEFAAGFMRHEGRCGGRNAFGPPFRMDDTQHESGGQ